MNNIYNPFLFKKKYHTGDITKYTYLVTGGAGFIGSNIVEYLVKFGAKKIRVLDNLSTGNFNNISKFSDAGLIEFINGDIRDFDTCINSLKDINIVFHQAALGSVPRSINDPLTTNQVNINGFLNILNASKNSNNVKKFIYASSSSVYGDSPILPKCENNFGIPLSPYALTKSVNELYASVFSRVYNFSTIGLRYFNVFGPNQSPDNNYAAVIPLFLKAFQENKSPIIFGDGSTSRDFTFVENVVQANIKCVFETHDYFNSIMNIACGEKISLNQIVDILNSFTKKDLIPDYQAERLGDIKESLADITLAKKNISYSPSINFKEGLLILLESNKHSYSFKP
jgi:UDP-N-acetylglucosamine 4-epimerase